MQTLPQYRALGRTGWRIAPVSFGAWAIGGDQWGATDDRESMRALHRAVDLGINFFDTADVYGDGRSERLVGQLRKERPEEIIVATKAGRRLPAQTPDGYNRANLTTWIDRSLRNLGTERLDLLQLHCPPSPVYDMPDVFGILDDLKHAGKLRHYGVSVETTDEGIRALQYQGVQSVQIIFNMFRHKPADVFLLEAERREVGVLARVPLASGLLSGNLNVDSHFSATDHRSFNRQGAAFDMGETFSGVDFDTGLLAVEELRTLVPPDLTMSQFALQWILSFPGITAAIPGARTPRQVEMNAHAMTLPPLPDATMAAVRAVYDQHIRAPVHERW